MARFYASIQSDSTTDFKNQLNTLLSPLLINTFLAFNLDCMDRQRRTGYEIDLSIEYDNGGIVLSNPFEVDVFEGKTLAEAQADAKAFADANPAYFIAPHFLCIRNPITRVPTFIVVVIYNQQGAAADTNWAVGAGGTAGSDVPILIPDLQVWYDADDASSYTLDGSDHLETWLDKSTNNFDVTQGTSTQRALKIDAGLNGKPVFQFDGNDHYDEPAGFLSFWEFDQTIFMVMRQLLSADEYAWGGQSGSNANGFRFISGDDFRFRTGTAVSDNLQINNVGVTSFHYYTLQKESATHRAWVDGNLEGSNGNAANSLPTNIAIGARAAGQQNLNGQIAELIFYNRALSSLERGQVETYIAQKWGL